MHAPPTPLLEEVNIGRGLEPSEPETWLFADDSFGAAGRRAKRKRLRVGIRASWRRVDKHVRHGRAPSFKASDREAGRRIQCDDEAIARRCLPWKQQHEIAPAVAIEVSACYEKAGPPTG